MSKDDHFDRSYLSEAPIPYGHQWISEDDIAEVIGVLRDERITQGPKIREFEEAVSAYCDAKYGVAFASGTAGLHAACAVAGIGSGHEVITTPLTFVATANSVLYLGARPVFSDIDPATLNLDPWQLGKNITSRTRAVIPVHFAGLPCQMEAIHVIAKAHGMITIEDACHALGAEIRTEEGLKAVGSCRYCDLTVFSFHPVKHITTGEGGMVLTNSAEFAERLRRFRHHGVHRDTLKAERAGPWYYEMEDLGFNYRITDFQCALGLSQIARLKDFLARRRVIAERYRNALRDLGLLFQESDPAIYTHAWHLFVVQLPLERLRAGRREVFDALRAKGIGVNVHYIPVYWHPYYHRLGYKPGACPVAETYYERALTLPLYPKMKDEEVDRVILAVGEVLDQYLL